MQIITSSFCAQSLGPTQVTALETSPAAAAGGTGKGPWPGHGQTRHCWHDEGTFLQESLVPPPAKRRSREKVSICTLKLKRDSLSLNCTIFPPKLSKSRDLIIKQLSGQYLRETKDWKDSEDSLHKVIQ